MNDALLLVASPDGTNVKTEFVWGTYVFSMLKAMAR